MFYKFFLLLVLIVGIAMGAFGFMVLGKKQPQSTMLVVPTPTLSPVKLKIVSWIPYWDQNTAFESFQKHVDLFDTIEVFWYRIDPLGRIKPYDLSGEDESIIDFAHAHGVKVHALIANLPSYEEGGDWDSVRVDKVIKTSQLRKKHIQAIMTLVSSKNFDGITIDYEALKAEQKENFSLFMYDLATSLHSEGKTLGIGIHPKTSENDPSEDNGSHAQDLVMLSKVADKLYFMTYTEHSISSEPGPLGNEDWMKKVLLYAIDTLKIPEEKIYMGLGLFGLSWEKRGKDFVGVEDDLKFVDISSLIASTSAKVVSDSKKGSTFSYDAKGVSHVVWFDDSKTLNEKINVAKQLRLGGLGMWRLGGEDEKVWDILKK